MKMASRSSRASRASRTSRSSNRAPVEEAPAPAAPKAAPKSPSKMLFEEGDAVMSKWPGTQLFFKTKVTYVRDDDNEYDVQFEDGTIYTLKAKDVKKSVIPATKTPKRSRSRGRSPSRKRKDAAPKSPDAKPKTPRYTTMHANRYFYLKSVTFKIKDQKFYH